MKDLVVGRLYLWKDTIVKLTKYDYENSNGTDWLCWVVFVENGYGTILRYSELSELSPVTKELYERGEEDDN